MKPERLAMGAGGDMWNIYFARGNAVR